MSGPLLDDFAAKVADWSLKDEWLGLALAQLPRCTSVASLPVHWQVSPGEEFSLCLGSAWWDLSPREQWAHTRLQVHHLLLGHLADCPQTPRHQLAVFWQAFHYLPQDLQMAWPDWQAFVATLSPLPAHPDLSCLVEQLDHQPWRDRFAGLLAYLEQSCAHWYLPFGKNNTRDAAQNLELQLITALAELPATPTWSEWVALWQKNQSVEIHWSLHLRRHLRRYRYRKLDFTHKRISRRYGSSPGIRLRQQAHLGVVLDTSASVSTGMLLRFYEELRLVHRLRHRILLLEADTAVRRVQYFDPHQQVRAFPGRGNTAYDSAIRYLVQQQVDLIIYLTDGLGPAPRSVATAILWVVQAAVQQEEAIRQKMADWPGSCIFLPAPRS